eukprot:5957075-Pleurochrysis_carterae.AAC.1
MGLMALSCALLTAALLTQRVVLVCISMARALSLFSLLHTTALSHTRRADARTLALALWLASSLALPLSLARLCSPPSLTVLV